MSGFPSGTSLKDDQFHLLVWLLLSLLSLFSYLKALNFARACNWPISAEMRFGISSKSYRVVIEQV